jgi:ATP-binding cassette subfamily B protein
MAKQKPAPPPVADAIRHSRQTVALVFETNAPLATGMVVLSVVTGLLPAAIAWAARMLVDAVERSANDPTAREGVVRLVAIELGLVLCLHAASRAQRTVSSLLGALVAERVNERILEKALGLELSDYEDPKIYDELTKARREASYRPLAHVDNLIGLFANTLTMLSLGAVLATLSGWAILGLVLASAPAFLAELRFDQDTFRLFSWKSEESRKQNYYELVITNAAHAKEVKLFGLGPMFLAKYRAIFWKLWKDDRDLALRRGLFGFLLGELGTLAHYALYGVVALRAARNEIGLGEMTLYLAAFRQGQGAVGQLLQGVSGVLEDRLYLATLLGFLGHRGHERPEGGALYGPNPADGLRFDNVSFAYPGADKPVLAGITLHLPPRHKLALVGENGAGKTTLIKLMTRLYRPTGGRVLLDGLDLEAWDQDVLRRRIGVIFQDFVQYQLTVGENIGVGDASAIDDPARLEAAAEKGGAKEVIDSLPKGYATQLGKWFDDGRELSLGQWQKIALSRAFMRTTADVLVLDEPTASMDAEAEAKIFARFRQLAADKTTVLISHRFSTVRMADTIAVLHQGVIEELGSHEELVQKNGRYARLFTLQAQGYR